MSFDPLAMLIPYIIQYLILCVCVGGGGGGGGSQGVPGGPRRSLSMLIGMIDATQSRTLPPL